MIDFIRELREAARQAPSGLGELLKRAAEEIEMLGATVDDEDMSMHQAVREAILNERSACATLADQAGCPAVAETIRARPSPVSS